MKKNIDLKKIGIVGVYSDTRTNNEDIAITPYLSLFYVNDIFNNIGRVFIAGISITFLYNSIGVGITYNYPHGRASFKFITRKTKKVPNESHKKY